MTIWVRYHAHSAQNFAPVVSSIVLEPSFWHFFKENDPKNQIFQKLADSMSSGMQNAQNFAAIVSSMVLEPSFFDPFFMFSQFWVFLRVWLRPGPRPGAAVGP